MEQKYSQIRQAGLGLAAVSYDSPAILKAFSQRMHIEFPLLSDQDSAIIRRFGILNEEVNKGTPTYGIPYPGVYVLDARGVVKAKFFEDDYRQRDTAGMILLEQFGIAPEKTSQPPIVARHVSLNLSATVLNPHMGQHLSLILDAVVPPGVHVYAPGVKGYMAIDWQTPATAAFDVGPVNYPPSRMMHLEAVQETVPVYTDHFRMVRNIALRNEKDILPLLDSAGNLTVAGTFRYQACDQEKCFIPETVPLKISLHFQSLDRTRAPENLRRKSGS